MDNRCVFCGKETCKCGEGGREGPRTEKAARKLLTEQLRSLARMARTIDRKGLPIFRQAISLLGDMLRRDGHALEVANFTLTTALDGEETTLYTGFYLEPIRREDLNDEVLRAIDGYFTYQDKMDKQEQRVNDLRDKARTAHQQASLKARMLKVLISSAHLFWGGRILRNLQQTGHATGLRSDLVKEAEADQAEIDRLQNVADQADEDATRLQNQLDDAPPLLRSWDRAITSALKAKHPELAHLDRFGNFRFGPDDNGQAQPYRRVFVRKEGTAADKAACEKLGCPVAVILESGLDLLSDIHNVPEAAGADAEKVASPIPPPDLGEDRHVKAYPAGDGPTVAEATAEQLRPRERPTETEEGQGDDDADYPMFDPAFPGAEEGPVAVVLKPEIHATPPRGWDDGNQGENEGDIETPAFDCAFPDDDRVAEEAAGAGTPTSEDDTRKPPGDHHDAGKPSD